MAMGITHLNKLDLWPYFSRSIRKRAILALLLRRLSLFRIVPALLFLSASERRRQRNVRKYKVVIPAVCVLSVTHRCNLDCKGCFAPVNAHAPALDPARIHAAATRLMAHGTSVFVITGGEPLTVKGLLPVLASLRKGIFLLFSNGLLFGEGIVSQLREASNVFPVISYEGDDELTDLRRGPGSSARIRKAMGDLRSRHILFGVSVTATRRNLHVLTSSDFANRMKEMGASVIFIIDYFATGSAWDAGSRLSASDQITLNAAISRQKKESGVLLVHLSEDENPDNTCVGGGTGLIHIDATGRVSPCPFLNHAVDSIFEKDYIDILKSETLVTFRRQAKEAIVKPCKPGIPDR